MSRPRASILATARVLVTASICLLLASSADVSGLAAQETLPPLTQPSAALSVYVITLGQGDQVWERYGHNALWIHDPVRGTDRTYNWGVFDASGPQFIVRFVRGRMRYWMESVDVERLMQFYRASDRSITIQRLALSPAQAAELQEFAEWNAREENKYYWYDYFRDNCSTRLRDAIDRALGGELRRLTEGQRTSNTYRSESVRLMEGMPLTQAGIYVGLGPLADRPLNAWEEMFVPMRMRDRLREMRIHAPDGSLVPLVAEERQAYVARRAPERAEAPSLFLRYAPIGLVVGLVVLALGLLTRVARPPFAGAAALWAGLTGVGGLLLLFLWFGTHHIFAYRNENLFQLSPIAIALAVVAPMALYRPRLRRLASSLGAVVVALALLGVALKVLPGFEQDNWGIIVLASPATLALGLILWRIARGERARQATHP